MIVESPGGNHLHILVVDDELLIRWSNNEALTAAGHVVTEAENAVAAVRAVTNAVPPDVVILDYRLPDSTDLTLLSKLRHLAPRAAVIFMTAFGSPDVVEGAMTLGAYRVLSKPFEVRDLPRLVLEAYMSRSESE